jgi:hypothetical protein
MKLLYSVFTACLLAASVQGAGLLSVLDKLPKCGVSSHRFSLKSPLFLTP